ncbi:MAG: magnesium transporter CorA family protein [Candidatus Eisenbacteria bacterium]
MTAAAAKNRNPDELTDLHVDDTERPLAEPRIFILAARGDTVTEHVPADLKGLLADSKTKVWIDLQNTGAAGFDQLAPALQFHPMAVEDCVVDINHPKVDDYRDYLYLALHSARWDDTTREPVLKEIDVLIGANYLVTYHEEETRGIERARVMLGRRGDLLSRGPDHLLHYILDIMVDNYLPIIEFIHTRVDDLEERVLQRPNKRVLAEILRLKGGVSAIRRVVGPQRDTILALTRDEFPGIRPVVRPTSATSTIASCGSATCSTHSATSWPPCSTSTSARCRTSSTR